MYRHRDRGAIPGLPRDRAGACQVALSRKRDETKRLAGKIGGTSTGTSITVHTYSPHPRRSIPDLPFTLQSRHLFLTFGIATKQTYRELINLQSLSERNTSILAADSVRADTKNFRQPEILNPGFPGYGRPRHPVTSARSTAGFDPQRSHHLSLRGTERAWRRCRSALFEWVGSESG